MDGLKEVRTNRRFVHTTQEHDTLGKGGGGRERGRERERGETKREIEREIERQRQKDGGTKTEQQRERERERGRETNRETYIKRKITLFTKFVTIHLRQRKL